MLKGEGRPAGMPVVRTRCSVQPPIQTGIVLTVQTVQKVQTVQE